MGDKRDAEFENLTSLDDEHWSEPVPATVRREVTISVRFSAEEIAAIRQRASAAGMKVTAYIRQAAIGSEASVDREKVANAVAAVSADLQRVRELVGEAAQK